MKKILVFGATGTIGLQTLDLIKKDHQFKLVGFSFFSNDKNAKLILEDFNDVKVFSPKFKTFNNVDGYQELIDKTKPDLIVNAIIGFPGIEISLLCIKNKINVALANKETIVICGDLFLNEAKKVINVYPIDSEHTALHELLKGHTENNVKKLFITASGGKYYSKNQIELNDVKYGDAIQHPIWNMGPRISIDSSTLINKFFEIIEAYYYFKKEVIVLYHPSAIIHAGIQNNNNGYHFLFSTPDMKYSIAQALNEFNYHQKVVDELDFNNMNLEINLMDVKKWLPLKWARDFFETKDSSIPIIVNALDEELIQLFKIGKIKFPDIVVIIDRYINLYKGKKIATIKEIYNFDLKMRNLIKKEF